MTNQTMNHVGKRRQGWVCPVRYGIARMVAPGRMRFRAWTRSAVGGPVTAATSRSSPSIVASLSDGGCDKPIVAGGYVVVRVGWTVLGVSRLKPGLQPLTGVSPNVCE